MLPHSAFSHNPCLPHTPHFPGPPLTSQKFNDAELEQQGLLFADEHDLGEHRDLFAKAALIARDPDNFARVGRLDEAERTELQYEADHRWSGTKTLYFAMLLCALGAATQGWDQTGSNGANLSFPKEFGIGAAVGQLNGERDEWIVGAINSAPYFSGAVIGTWISDPLNHWLGRRGEIFVTGVILVVTPIGAAFSQTWAQMLIIRIIMGIGMGAKAATVPIYSAEMAPTRIRGALTMGWQLWVCFGIFLGFAANIVVMNTGKIAWRLQIGSAFIPALPLTMFIFLIPESPRWLMKKGRFRDSFKSYNRIRRAPIIAARDMFYSHVLYEEERLQARGASYMTRLVDCFRVPRIRRATLGAGVVMLSQQLCGINIISFYSSTVFVESGSTTRQALYASLGFGALNFAFAIPAVFIIDTFGRRSLLLSTFPGMAVSLFATAMSFLMSKARQQARLALIATFIYIFTAFYSIGEGPVCFLYGAEVFPTIQREQGMAFAVTINLFFAGVLGITFPPMLRKMHAIGAVSRANLALITSLILSLCSMPASTSLR